MKNIDMIPSEHAEQCALAKWLTDRGIKFFAVPNGAKMGSREAAKMKKEGLSPGVPDIVIVHDGKTIAIEMKKRGGKKPRSNQVAWIQHLEKNGWIVGVCYGAEEAIIFLRPIVAAPCVIPIDASRTRQIGEA